MIMQRCAVIPSMPGRLSAMCHEYPFLDAAAMWPRCIPTQRIAAHLESQYGTDEVADDSVLTQMAAGIKIR